MPLPTRSSDSDWHKHSLLTNVVMNARAKMPSHFAFLIIVPRRGLMFRCSLQANVTEMRVWNTRVLRTDIDRCRRWRGKYCEISILDQSYATVFQPWISNYAISMQLSRLSSLHARAARVAENELRSDLTDHKNCFANRFLGISEVVQLARCRAMEMHKLFWATLTKRELDVNCNRWALSTCFSTLLCNSSLSRTSPQLVRKQKLASDHVFSAFTNRIFLHSNYVRIANKRRERRFIHRHVSRGFVMKRISIVRFIIRVRSLTVENTFQK